MRDSKPHRRVQPHMLLKVTRNATNGNKHINEASKQTFTNILFKLSCEYTQGMYSSWNVCFNVFKIRTYDEFLCSLSKIIETV